MTSISVVIPALDDADMLERCLADLSAQVRPADEIIVVDNGSTDETVAVARAAGVRVLSESLRGIWPAAATGYDAATGEIIARLDADSRPPVDWLARIETEFAHDPEIAILTGPGDFYGGNWFVRILGQYLYMDGYFWSMTLWLGHNPVYGSNFAMRSETWHEVRGRVHRELRAIHDDLDLSVHLLPQQVVRLDRRFRVGISARPFDTWRGLGRRIGWAYLTLRLHWPEETPWSMRAAKRHWEAEQRELPGAIA
ncbi:MAG TPA: glycosyltransferase family 2 protein [Microbacteriaceae bacterium]|nr:glycosyltransferase family 2 protein [Microbacteriaceae bacterium]